MVNLIRNKSLFMMSIFFNILLLTSLINSPNLATADQFKIITETAQPNLDGNITNEEWVNAVQFESTLGDKTVSVFVTSNKSNLYFALNFSSIFVPLNMSLPENESAHDFVALQIDRNLDGLNFGSPEFPDDVLVYNQYKNESVDAFTNTTLSPFIPDVNVTGFNDGSANYTYANNQISYEFSKPKSSNDVAGNDFSFSDTKILKFKFLAWFNQTANATLNDAFQTNWFSVQLNTTGTGFAEAVSYRNTSLTVDISGYDSSAVEALTSILSFSGYDVNFRVDNSTIDLADNETYVLLVGPNGLSDGDVEAIKQHVKFGGSVYLMLTDEDTSLSNNIAQIFEMTYQGSSIVSSEANETITINSFSDMPFYSGNSIITDDLVSDVRFQGHALSTREINSNNSLILSQKYLDYDVFEMPDGLKIDNNANQIYEDKDGEFSEDLTVAKAFDFSEGGRALVTSFNALSSDFILNSSNIAFFYRSLAWVTKQTHALILQNSTISGYSFVQGDTVELELNVSDLFGNDLEEAVTINLTLSRADNTELRENFVHNANNIYRTSIELTKFGFETIDIMGFADYYGFIQTDTIYIFVDQAKKTFNPLSSINPFIAIVSVLGIGSSMFLMLKKLNQLKK